MDPVQEPCTRFLDSHLQQKLWVLHCLLIVHGLAVQMQLHVHGYLSLDRLMQMQHTLCTLTVILNSGLFRLSVPDRCGHALR